MPDRVCIRRVAHGVAFATPAQGTGMRNARGTPAMPTLEALIRDSSWAAALDEDELDRVLGESIERRIPTGGHAVRCGEPADYWFGVIEGLV
jgi:hypothetical protein